MQVGLSPDAVEQCKKQCGRPAAHGCFPYCAECLSRMKDLINPPPRPKRKLTYEDLSCEITQLKAEVAELRDRIALIERERKEPT